MSGSSSAKAQGIIRILSARYGVIPWWPGDTDEVMIGAILTQQTRWENVERALSQLHASGLNSIASINAAEVSEIEKAIRCTGFFRIKSRRLKALAIHVIGTYGSIAKMANAPDETLRKNLLGVKGIGEETADSILCYGFSRRSFVVDAYTERIARCAGINEKRSLLKALFEGVLPCDLSQYRQAHAHIVEYSKECCQKKRCDECQIAILNG